ncbi:MAG: hypothetical protein C0507_16470 [Cyanobacteria bacterium PR.3.49]|nr:hypothetical protein [Cyanobacteria bacterium PR.3.49]
MKKRALLGIALLAGLVVSTSNAQPANAQIMDALKNALVGQLGGGASNLLGGGAGNILNGASSNFNNNPYNQYGSQYDGQFDGQYGSQFAGQDVYNTPSTGNGLVDSLLPLIQNSGVGSNLLNNYLPQAQGFSNSPLMGNNYPANLSNGLLGGLSGYGNFGGVQPVVFNGVTLDSQIYSGPYRGTSHQVESAMNLDWQMTVLREQIGLGASQGFLLQNDANMFNNELNRLVSQKQRVVRRNGLSFNDSQELVERLFNLVVRVREAWYSNTGFGNGNAWSGPGRGHRGRFARADAYGQVMNSNRNEALDNLYLQMQPNAGFRR